MYYEKPMKRYLRETALKLFKSQSFEEVTVNDICKACSVNKHTFYYYFRSKEDLLKDCESPSLLSPQEIVDIISSESYMEQYWLINKPFLDFVEVSGINLMKKIFMKRIYDNDETLMPLRELPEFIKMQLDIIDKGKKSGQFLTNIETKTLFVISRNLMHSVSVNWCVRKGHFDLSYQLRYLLECLFEVKEEYRTCLDSPLESLWRARFGDEQPPGGSVNIGAK
jgi:hypothetical protein